MSEKKILTELATLSEDNSCFIRILPNSKVALDKGWQHSTSRVGVDEGLSHIKDGGNLAYFCGNKILVVDVDVADGKRGAETFNKLMLLCGEKIKGTVHTQSGGLHCYIQVPRQYRGFSVGDISKELRLSEGGVDIKWHNAYVLVPPSKIESKSYKFIGDSIQINKGDVANKLLSVLLPNEELRLGVFADDTNSAFTEDTPPITTPPLPEAEIITESDGVSICEDNDIKKLLNDLLTFSVDRKMSNDEWFIVMCGLYHNYGVIQNRAHEGYSIFIDWCKELEKVGGGKCKNDVSARWGSIGREYKNNRKTIASVYLLRKELGIDYYTRLAKGVNRQNWQEFCKGVRSLNLEVGESENLEKELKKTTERLGLTADMTNDIMYKGLGISSKNLWEILHEDLYYLPYENSYYSYKHNTYLKSNDGLDKHYLEIMPMAISQNKGKKRAKLSEYLMRWEKLPFKTVDRVSFNCLTSDKEFSLEGEVHLNKFKTDMVRTADDRLGESGKRFGEMWRQLVEVFMSCEMKLPMPHDDNYANFDADVDIKDQTEGDILLQYMAWCYQNVGTKNFRVAWTPILVSELEGSGKDMLGANVFRVLFGRLITTVGTKELASNFSCWKDAEACIYNFSELRTAGQNRSVIEADLFPDITDTYVKVVPKGRSAFTKLACANFIASSNFHNPVKVREQSRRWYVMLSNACDIGVYAKDFEERTGMEMHEFFSEYAGLLDSAKGAIAKLFADIKITTGFKKVVNSRAPMTDTMRDTLMDYDRDNIKHLAEANDLLESNNYYFNKEFIVYKEFKSNLESNLNLVIEPYKMCLLLKEMGYSKLSWADNKRYQYRYNKNDQWLTSAVYHNRKMTNLKEVRQNPSEFVQKSLKINEDAESNTNSNNNNNNNNIGEFTNDDINF